MTISILDTRVPQPGDYASYGVPEEIGMGVDALLKQRNECGEELVGVIDGAILRILRPWFRKPMIEDLGSITAIDTGFDVRTQNMPVNLRLVPGVEYDIRHELKPTMPSESRSRLSLTRGTAEEICEMLTRCGYTVHVPLPNGRHIVAKGGGFEVQPYNDNYWIKVKNLSQALVAHRHPELYRE